MKINYVLVDDANYKRRDARQPRTENKNIQVGEALIGRILPQPPPRQMISEEELRLVTDMVRQSGYFERNKTGDVDQALIRQLIRSGLSPELSLFIFLSGQTGGIPGASEPPRDEGAQGCAEQESGQLCREFDCSAAPTDDRQRTCE